MRRNAASTGPYGSAVMSQSNHAQWYATHTQRRPWLCLHECRTRVERSACAAPLLGACRAIVCVAKRHDGRVVGA